MNVQRPTRRSVSEKQATGTILVIWIVFYEFTFCNNLPQLLNCYTPQNALVGGVLRKLELSFFDFSLYSDEDVHLLIEC